MNMCQKTLALLFALVIVTSCQPQCPLTQYDGYQGDISMVSHQARGVISVQAQGCSFSVTRFEVVGFEGMQWIAADALDLDSILNGVSLGGEDQLSSDNYLTSYQIQIPQDLWSQLGSMTVLVLWIPSVSRLVGYNVLGSQERAVTMYDFCIQHTQTSQLRWSIFLGDDNDTSYGDFAIEGQIPQNTYHSIGFPLRGARNRVMGGADSIVYAVINNEPYALDYYLKGYLECGVDQNGVQDGVCRDEQFDGVNNVNLTYSQQVDGTWLINARRFLISTDKLHDQDIYPLEPMQFIWAVANFEIDQDNLPSLRYHATSYGEPLLTLIDGSAPEDLPTCQLLYDSLAISTGSSYLIENISAPLNVTVGGQSVVHPLTGDLTIYINGLPQPTLIVSPGQEIVFNLQFGINLAITDSSLGGSYMANSQIFAQGADQVRWTVQSSNNGDIYYRTKDQALIGGRILLKEQEVASDIEYKFQADWGALLVKWGVSGSEENSMISWNVEAKRSAGWICIGFGSGMKGGYAYVGWMDDNGEGMVHGYYMTGQDEDDVHLDPDVQILNPVIEQDGTTGRLTMSFQRTFSPSSSKEPRILNGDNGMIWAYGSTWRKQDLRDSDKHTEWGVEKVNVVSGDSKAVELDEVWIIHGVFMFVAWSVFVPGAVIVARFFKPELGKKWILVHKILNIAGVVLMIIGSAIAINEMQENGQEHFKTTHTKLGLAMLIIGVVQIIQGNIRPNKPGPNATRKEVLKRNLWGVPHIFIGYSLFILSHAAIITGLQAMEIKPGAGEMWKWEVSVYIWIGLIGLIWIVLQTLQVRKQQSEFTQQFVTDKDQNIEMTQAQVAKFHL